MVFARHTYIYFTTPTFHLEPLYCPVWWECGLDYCRSWNRRGDSGAYLDLDDTTETSASYYYD